MLKKKRSFQVVEPGVYLAPIRNVLVEVLKQDSMSGNIWLEVYGESDPEDRFEGISASLFMKLFVKADMQAVKLASIPKG